MIFVLASFNKIRIWLRPYSAVLSFSFMILPIFRPDGALFYGTKMVFVFILLLKEVAFDACQKMEDDPNRQI